MLLVDKDMYRHVHICAEREKNEKAMGKCFQSTGIKFDENIRENASCRQGHVSICIHTYMSRCTRTTPDRAQSRSLKLADISAVGRSYIVRNRQRSDEYLTFTWNKSITSYAV